MAKISNEADARRLARVIAADIKLYHEDAIREGADLSSEVAEGRALFESRVIDPLYGLFDEALAAIAPDVRFGSRGAAAGGVGSKARSTGNGVAAGAVAAAPRAEAAPNRFGSFYADGSDPAAAQPKLARAPDESSSGGGRSRLVLVLIVLVVTAILGWLLASR
jgi:hypothetical protein